MFLILKKIPTNSAAINPPYVPAFFIGALFDFAETLR